jgi:hypothetical protein
LRGALGSGAQIGQNLSGLGGPFQNLPQGGSLGQGLGQVVSGWARDGIHGPELAERVHWLQQTRNSERNRPGADHDGHDTWRKDAARDLREDRREIARDERRIRDDERRLVGDRAELHRDLADYRRDRDRANDRHGKTDRDERHERDRDRDHDWDHLARHERDRDHDRDDRRSRDSHQDRDGHGQDHHVLTSHNDHVTTANGNDSPSPSHHPEASHHPASGHNVVTPSHAPVSKGKGR